MSSDQEIGVKRVYEGDYLNVPSRPLLVKILDKQGDRKVMFADKVLKLTGSGKMKRCILLITDFALYVIDPNTDVLKRRITLAAVEKLCMSESSDNFFAIIIPTEYDLLMASTRKTEIVKVLVEATKSASDYELDVLLSNSANLIGQHSKASTTHKSRRDKPKPRNYLSRILSVQICSRGANCQTMCYNRRFEYQAAANRKKEVHFEDVEGGVKARIVPK